MSNLGESVYGRSIVVDATAPIAPIGTFPTTANPVDLVGVYERAGVTLALFTIVDDFPNSIEQTIKLIAANRRYFLGAPQQYAIIDKPVDVIAAKEKNKLAIGFAFQGSNGLLGSLELVEVYRRLGVIQMQLTYNTANFAADGCHERRNAGLSQFGRLLVGEMNRVGMIVDVSHVGLRSSLEALELTSRPPIFSHSAPKAFARHDRNIADEQIRACAAKDGVVCLTGVGIFLDGETGSASTLRFVDSIEYVAQVVGARHAGIGLDYVMDREALASYIRSNSTIYGGGSQYPSDGYIDFVPPSVLPEVANELLRRGYAEEDVRGVLGGNYLRVFEANQ
jgi:membrane dipeptidase